MCKAATVEIIEDSERVRIVRYTMEPGTETGWHTHALDYVIVPYDDCRVHVESRTATVEAEMKRAAPYFRKAGAEHNVKSAMDHPFAFLEIELKP